MNISFAGSYGAWAKRGVILGTIILAFSSTVAVAEPSMGMFGSQALFNAASTIALPNINRLAVREERMIAEVTAYTSRAEETDADGHISADGNYVYDGLIACSREYPFGTRVVVNSRTYRCGDRMARKNDHAVNLSLAKPRFDIWMSDLSDAKKWGRREVAVVVLPPTN